MRDRVSDPNLLQMAPKKAPAKTTAKKVAPVKKVIKKKSVRVLPPTPSPRVLCTSCGSSECSAT